MLLKEPNYSKKVGIDLINWPFFFSLSADDFILLHQYHISKMVVIHPFMLFWGDHVFQYSTVFVFTKNTFLEEQDPNAQFVNEAFFNTEQ